MRLSRNQRSTRCTTEEESLQSVKRRKKRGETKIKKIPSLDTLVRMEELPKKKNKKRCRQDSPSTMTIWGGALGDTGERRGLSRYQGVAGKLSSPLDKERSNP